ncbi:MAG TPA: hypothetical protein VMZ29_03870 [Candidatus Bathyarchaeia archaeon]|nr:hypothetical protein [Candidatus Bathyarchaeia archaeon]
MATESKDAISYKQKPVKIIRDRKILELFKDENLDIVLKFLKKGPMSITDIEESFKKIGDEKSDKSIYRYLHKLIQAKLVAKAGKRITSTNESNLITETIYSRVAIAFITVTPVDDRECQGTETCPVWEATRVLLQEFFGKNADPTIFANFCSQLDSDKDDLVIGLFENATEETLEKIAHLDYMGVNYVLQFAGWLAFSTKLDIGPKLKEIFNE